MNEIIQLLSALNKPPYTFIITDLSGNIVYPKNNTIIASQLATASEGVLYDRNNHKWYQHDTIRVGDYNIERYYDITALQQTIMENSYDNLTRVLTRKVILEKFHNGVRNINSSSQSMCIAICDIDNFRDINNFYGHNAGDDVLRAIGNIFLANTTNTGISVGRFAGDEFFVVGDNWEMEAFKALMNKIREEIANLRFNSLDSHFIVTASMGLYQCNPDGIDVNDPRAVEEEARSLFECADTALYDSKEQGRNKINIFTYRHK